MRYCARCCYPANAKPTISFDEEGVCSGCRYHESRSKIHWQEREKLLKELLEPFKRQAREKKAIYDCIIPVSGGKDSTYQAHLIKNVYGMNPLLVTYNHALNTAVGIQNLNNLVAKLELDLIRFTANPGAVRRVARHMLKTVGDITWHYHAGIRTFPYQIAVKYKIPLIIWGEEGFSELTGMFSLEDGVEHTKWSRQEHSMRGYEPEDLVNDPSSGVKPQDVAPYVYPSDEEIEELNVRGIYLSNFIYWDAKTHAEFVMKNYGFQCWEGRRERTFNLHGKIEDHAQEVHDYLKYVKFGYGRATDDASMEVRHGRMSREEAIEAVRLYDSVRPSSLTQYLKWLDVREEEFWAWLEPMRDKTIWGKQSNGSWAVNDCVTNHINDPGIEKARVKLLPADERTYSTKNRALYFSEEQWRNAPLIDQNHGFRYRYPGQEFIVL